MSVAEPDPAAASEDRPHDEAPAAPSGAVARIQSVEIENLRGIKSGKLEGLAPLTVLTGPNGSGKSTVLDALDIGGSPNVTGALWDCVHRRPSMPLGALWLYRYGRGDCPVIRCENRRGNWRTIQLPLAYAAERRPFAVAVGIYDGRMESEDHLVPDENFSQFIVNFGDDQDRPIRGGAFDLEGVQGVTAVQGLATGISRGLEAHQLFSTARRKGRYLEALAVARALYPEIEGLNIQDEGDGSYLVFSWSERIVPATVSGDGAYAALRLGLEMLIADGVILLEEPEAHLHPAAMVLVAKAIVNAVRSGTQVVLTTHSLEFIDCLLDACREDVDDLLALFLVSLRDGELVNVRFDGGEVRFSRDQIGEDMR